MLILNFHANLYANLCLGRVSNGVFDVLDKSLSNKPSLSNLGKQTKLTYHLKITLILVGNPRTAKVATSGKLLAVGSHFRAVATTMRT